MICPTRRRIHLDCIAQAPVPTTKDSEAHSPRDQDLQKVHDCFSPAMQPDEKLRAAPAVTPHPPTMFSSLLRTAKDIIG
jgi:hypothetical protein